MRHFLFTTAVVILMLPAAFVAVVALILIAGLAGFCEMVKRGTK